ncbi:MAG: cobalt-precorrin 5A hydrolase [Lachnospiraceae bacterium]|nr:cobalt-precorrin 5A hydrolase [Lachnospiraceae bacterium]
MSISIISFTKNGKQLSEKIARILSEDVEMQAAKSEVHLYTKCEACMSDNFNSSISFVKTSVREWAGEQMRKRNALLFIGACGIAVRAVAPFITDKLHDAPVLVMDEAGKYIIPILSGHMGGANELANHIAGITGAEPVITTATDINQKFTVDLFAKRNGLFIVNKDGIVKVSSKVLAGNEITMSIETGHYEKYMPPDEMGLVTYPPDGVGLAVYPLEGVRLIPYPPTKAVDIVVTSESVMFDTAILLKPKEYVIGIGCRRGKSTDDIDKFLTKKINELGISITQILAVSSISQKRDEQGIIEWCQKEGLPFWTYTSEELQEVEGNFTESAFVKEQVGVDNVCERAALRACGEAGKLILPKCAENGMTLAIAKREWKVCFDGK